VLRAVANAFSLVRAALAAVPLNHPLVDGMKEKNT